MSQVNRLTPQTGFTLIELVLVMVLIGILGAVALPRLMVGSQFEERLQADKLVGLLRQAQLRAMNDPQAVSGGSPLSRCAKVTFTSSTTTTPGFSIANDCKAGAGLLSAPTIKNESQQGHFVGVLNLTVTSPQSLPFTLQFGQAGLDSNFLSKASLLGRPFIGGVQLTDTLEITIGGKKVLIEPEGYIHAP